MLAIKYSDINGVRGFVPVLAALSVLLFFNLHLFFFLKKRYGRMSVFIGAAELRNTDSF